MAIEEGEFIKIDYVGESQGEIFDLTKEELAKEKDLYREDAEYEPRVIVVGAGHILEGVEEELIGKKVGEEYDIEVQPEDGFGKRNSDLLKIISRSEFKDKNVNPYPGLRVNIDGRMGTIKSVGSGRIVVDFNHPLAGKELEYHIEILEKVEDDEEKVEALVNSLPNFSKEKWDVEITDGTAKVDFELNLPPKIKEKIEEEIEEYTDLEADIETPEESEEKSEEEATEEDEEEGEKEMDEDENKESEEKEENEE